LSYRKRVHVAIAGCVGNLPKVNNMDIQYAQAAVLHHLILLSK
jgi:hypothetical protein